MHRSFFAKCFDLCQTLVKKIVCTEIFSFDQLFIKMLSVLIKMSEFDALTSKQSVNLSELDRLMFTKNQDNLIIYFVLYFSDWGK